MQRARKILIAKFVTVLSVIPAIVIAREDGAPARSTGAPGEQTCAQSQCHLGSPVNSANGNVQVTYSGGTSYVPGQRGKFTVTVNDTGGGRSAYGFQAVAKLAGDAQAGAWVPGPGLRVECADERVPTPDCRPDAPQQYITHSLARPSSTFEFEWTPPASPSGDVRVYVAGNAANGDGTERGDRIYTASLTLTPAAAGGPRPTIATGGIADAFNYQEGVAENSWVTLFGSNLSAETRTWDGSAEFSQQRLPTSLGGVSVTIDGKPAPVYSVSAGQVNVLTPIAIGTGNVQVVLRNANGESTATARALNLLPGFYAPFAQDGTLFVTGRENSSAAILGKPGVETRALRAFRPGDIVQLYANGLGPTNPPVGENQFIPQGTARPLANQPVVRIRDTAVEVLGSALVGSGFYQINARIPDVPNGDHPIVLEIGGARSANNVYITIQR